jgi:hypothetical protein
LAARFKASGMAKTPYGNFVTLHTGHHFLRIFTTACSPPVPRRLPRKTEFAIEGSAVCRWGCGAVAADGLNRDPGSAEVQAR